MKLKTLFKNILLGKPPVTNREIDVFTEARESLAANSRLDADEKKFINQLYDLVESNSADTDYEALAKDAPSVNIEFWYESAVAMSLAANKHDLDIRSNGRLQTAHVILTKIMAHSDRVAPFWAQKIAILDYLATGHREQGDLQSSDEYTQQAHKATVTACEYFPEIAWFSDKHQEMLKKSQ